MTRTRRGRTNLPMLLRTPLARWGFTACALLAAGTDQAWPFAITALLATYGWRTRPKRRIRTRRR